VCCLESKEHGRFNATIVSIGCDDVSITTTVNSADNRNFKHRVN